ncbi:MAG: M14 family zinc carboxypeptidase [Lachnospiraceae bacterium]|nr:M14 family zinc carboxypeptidase [Lachnospiraceae bacterium]
MKRKQIYAGVLAAIMAAGSSFVVYAEPAGTGLESAIEVNTESSAAPTEAPAPAETSQSTVVTVEPAQPQSSAAQTEPAQPQPSAAQNEPAQSQSAVVTAETTQSAPTEAPQQTPAAPSSSVSAGSTTVTAGSRVVGAGSAGSGSQVAGPGMSGTLGQLGTGSLETGQLGAGQTVVDGGNASFAGTLSSPIVNAVEKYSYDQMCKDIQSLSSRYGDRMHVNEIGTSWDGRKLYEIVLGNANAGKHILIHAGIHAREYMTPLLVMKQLEHGLEFYNSGSYEGVPLSTLFDQVAIHYVPMVNPDGISISQFGISAIRSEQLRQTINQCYALDVAEGRTSAAFDRYLNYWKANGRGVDLNQNFDADWDQVTSCGHPSYATYKGDSRVSEPESQALVNLTNSRTWALTISYHSMGNIIYWDYSGNKVSAQSRELANLIAAKTGYRLAGSSGHGGYKDWVQIKDGPIPSLTLEVGSVSCPMPVSEFMNVWNRNQEVWAAAAKYAMEH